MRKISIAEIILFFTAFNILLASALGYLAAQKDAEHYADFKMIPLPENGFVCVEESPLNGIIRVSGTRQGVFRDRIAYSYNKDGIINYDVTLYYEDTTGAGAVAKEVSAVMRSIEKLDEKMLTELIEKAETSDNIVGEKRAIKSGATVTAKYALEKGEKCIRIEMKLSR